LSKIKITTEDVRRELNRRKYNKIGTFFPDNTRDGYVKHLQFFKDGNQYRERIFLAANRAGKTEAGAYETACHLTGIYPKWWEGRRFNKPVSIIAAGETGKLVRDSIQKKLLGDVSDIGSGMIPRDLITDKKPKSGIPDAFDTVRIKHSTGGISTLQFQSYDQGREAFQSTERDLIWFDEEPPLSVYTEGLIRTMTTNGIMMTTFTPLKGVSETVLSLQAKAETNAASLIMATWDDAPHLTEKDKEEMLAALPPHQRDARSKGVPALGSGAIFPVPESEVIIEPFAIPNHWDWVYGLDVGWNNTAAVWLAYNRDYDTAYVVNEYKRGQCEPIIHASAIKEQGEMTGVIDPASRGRNSVDGQDLLSLYRKHGLNLTEADNGVSAGLLEVYQRLSTGRLKIFRTCVKTLEEYRLYRRDERGNVVKENDHLMDALRYAIMSGLSQARPKEIYRKKIIIPKERGMF
jgi:phage terminase large subunit-like protein